MTLQEEAQQHPGKVVKINRAPVLTLWVKTVAEREGYAFSTGALAHKQSHNSSVQRTFSGSYLALGCKYSSAPVRLQVHQCPCESAGMMRMRR